MARIMIAIVDDSMRRFISNKLMRAGHAVSRVENYEASLTLLCEAAYDVLMVSGAELDTSEIDLLGHALALDPEMQVIMTNGFSVECVEHDYSGLETRSEVKLAPPVHLNYLADEVARLTAA